MSLSHGWIVILHLHLGDDALGDANINIKKIEP
jgi:hypothetical protein